MSELVFLPVDDQDASPQAHSYKANQWAFFDRAKDFVNGGNNRYFLQTLVRYANSDNSCWRTVETFASDMGIGEKTVRRAIKYLEDLDLIVVIRKRSKEGRSHPNIYMLNLHSESLHAVTMTSTKTLDKVTVTDTQALDTVTMTSTHGVDAVTVTSTQSLDAVTMTGACGKLSKNDDENSLRCGHTVHEIRSHSPRDAVTVTDKYKVNINKNINTGGESKLAPSGKEIFLNHPNLESSTKSLSGDVIKRMDLWTYFKTVAKRDYEITLPSTPSELDLKAFDYLEEVYSVDLSKRINWVSLDTFVFDELGKPEKVFNPAVRLMMATEEHPEHSNRFSDRMLVESFDFVFFGDDDQN